MIRQSRGIHAIVLLAAFCGTSCMASAQAVWPDTTSMQREIVSKLSGASEVRPGLILADRRSMENKQEARAYLAHLLEQLRLEPKRQDYSVEGQNVYAILSCGRPSSQTIVLVRTL